MEMTSVAQRLFDQPVTPTILMPPLFPTVTATPHGGRRDEIIEHIYSRCTVIDLGYQSEDGTCNECYIWGGGSTGKTGRGANYPKMSLNSQSVRVHRVVMTHYEGYIPSRRQVDHRCHNRMCVRYEHLRQATHKQNMLFRDIANGVVRRKKRRKKVRKPS